MTLAGGLVFSSALLVHVAVHQHFAGYGVLARWPASCPVFFPVQLFSQYTLISTPQAGRYAFNSPILIICLWNTRPPARRQRRRRGRLLRKCSIGAPPCRRKRSSGRGIPREPSPAAAGRNRCAPRPGSSVLRTISPAPRFALPPPSPRVSSHCVHTGAALVAGILVDVIARRSCVNQVSIPPRYTARQSGQLRRVISVVGSARSRELIEILSALKERILCRVFPAT